MSEAYVGEIRMFAGNFAPKDWAFCTGQTISIAQNQMLFSLLGTTYGGDGRTSFALPNLKGKVPINQGTGVGLSARELGQTGGEPTVSLEETQMPSHNHILYGSDQTASASAPSGSVFGSTSRNMYNLPPVDGSLGEAIAEAGSGQAHNNMMPYLALNFIICLQGIYPPRN